MAASLAEILTALQDGVRAINNLKTALNNIFPQASAVSVTPPTGTITYTSSQAAAFLSVQTSSGGVYKVPLYS